MRTPIYLQVDQARRAQRFPANRIAFLGTETAAEADKATFKAFQYGNISVSTACKRIAETNLLEKVTEEQFLNECELLGYARHIKR